MGEGGLTENGKPYDGFGPGKLGRTLRSSGSSSAAPLQQRGLGHRLRGLL
jgi:hypothetical protein